MSDSSNSVEIPRAFFEGKEWMAKRRFSKAEAIIDLIQSAEKEDSIIRFANGEISIRKGEVYATRRYLKQRWGWKHHEALQKLIHELVDSGCAEIVKPEHCTYRGPTPTILKLNLERMQKHEKTHLEKAREFYHSSIERIESQTKRDFTEDAKKLSASIRESIHEGTNVELVLCEMLIKAINKESSK